MITVIGCLALSGLTLSDVTSNDVMQDVGAAR